MNSILNNPYRIVGLLVGATAREQERQIKRLKQFIEAEEAPQDDYSFPILGPLNRTVENVTDAASRLNLDSDRMSASLFWFYKGNSIIDELAFEALKASNPVNCIEIWKKYTVSGEVTQLNCAAFQNLSTLALFYAFNDSIIDVNLLNGGISLKLKFLESDFIQDFKTLATDETYKTTKKDLQLLFLTKLQSDIDMKSSIFSNKFLEILINLEFLAKEDFLKVFVQKPITQIEKIVTETKNKRKENKANALKMGVSLYEETLESLSQIKSVLGVSDIEFTSISDKVSDEILQCGIDYFSYCQDSKPDNGSLSLDLFRKANSFAISNIAKQRCQENISQLCEWNNKLERDKKKLIEQDVEFITSKIEWLQNLSDIAENPSDIVKLLHYDSSSKIQDLEKMVESANVFVEYCKPKLVNIKNTLGSTDEFYLEICGVVVFNAQSVLVAAVNDGQEEINNPQVNPFGGMPKYISPTKDYSKLFMLAYKAYNLMESMESLDMVNSLRQSFQNNKEILQKIYLSIGRTIRPPKKSSGCYIATMAYGDYDHPQVIILRTFRDNVLDKSIFGKIFIKIYYKYSPKLVEKLNDKKAVNSFIRKSLNQFIKLIK